MISVDVSRLLDDSPAFNRRLDCRELSRIQLPDSPVIHSRPKTFDIREFETLISGVDLVARPVFPVDVPVTASSHYGWVCPKESCHWRRPKVVREIVRYAQIYYEQNGYNPYQRVKN